jgi:hypothetical protein
VFELNTSNGGYFDPSPHLTLRYIDYWHVDQLENGKTVSKQARETEPNSNSRISKVYDWCIQRTSHIEGQIAKVALKVLIIGRRNHSEIGIDRTLFLAVFFEFGLDPRVLYFILRDVDGFHKLTDVGINDDPTLQPTYFVGVRGSHMFAWSFNPQTKQTMAILIGRPSLIEATESMIDIYMEYVSHHRLLLAVVCAGQLLERVDHEITQELSVVEDVEKRTGYNPWVEAEDHDSARSIHDGDTNPTVLSGLLSATEIVLALHRKYLTSVRVIAEALIAQTPDPTLASTDDSFPGVQIPSSRRKFDEVISVANAFYSEAQRKEEFLEFIQNRAHIQQTIVGSPYLWQLFFLKAEISSVGDP